ncbi:hypothetical protein B4U80_13750 [Leptotrombidium deliense]|uniref:Ig-like domain-containing protein n=1 Tax=Leptotrombidium deliense TaxID=299467 RepID=A0A443SGT3_9ACAR|nr:hypothetical protein B4U80_13750 [Leptotrombidium deliense]
MKVKHAFKGTNVLKESVKIKFIVYGKLKFLNSNVVKVTEGFDANLLCEVARDDAMKEFNLKWEQNEKTVAEDSRITIKRDSQKPQSTLRINSIRRNDTGNYTCRAMIFYTLKSQIEATNIFLDVQCMVTNPPAFLNNTPEFVWVPKTINGSYVTNVTCAVDANPKASFSWSRNSAAYQRNKFEEENMSTLQLEFRDYDEKSGSYVCTANNNIFVPGTAKATHTFRVKEGDYPPQPVITSLPPPSRNYHISLSIEEPMDMEPKLDKYRLTFSGKQNMEETMFELEFNAIQYMHL